VNRSRRVLLTRVPTPQIRIAKVATAHADSVKLATEQFKVVKNREQYIEQLEDAIVKLRDAGGPVRSRVDLGEMHTQLKLGVFKARRFVVGGAPPFTLSGLP